MRLPYGETVLVQTFESGAEDANGNEAASWSPGTPVAGCGFAPNGSSELADGRVAQTPTLYPPKSVTIGPRDRVVRRGVTYEVDGQPEDWEHPMTGWDPGYLVVPLRVVD